MKHSKSKFDPTKILITKILKNFIYTFYDRLKTAKIFFGFLLVLYYINFSLENVTELFSVDYNPASNQFLIGVSPSRAQTLEFFLIEVNLYHSTTSSSLNGVLMSIFTY